ncbi:DUF1360 domain-containing protein [Iamia sp. SCSIO 61187]|uniref:DUF1360 domain-containing protein n=1 Tax=Iamia sp. SCSIO 61187 TaxID=2722752 RepID=UPI001C628D8E|nr:DUF1360 domain-containing protein [Iamia sp. SCSIO 61187]QYG93992.1 DUF1360 domain-containing protein [Iamia sp. SCSIO 61187]
MDPLELVVDGLAAYRLTRLATADVISEPWRRSVVDRLVANGEEPPGEGDTAQDVVDAMREPPRLATLLTCRWCAGMWIAAGVVGARTLAPKAWSPVARTLALSAAATLIARAEDDG